MDSSAPPTVPSGPPATASPGTASKKEDESPFLELTTAKEEETAQPKPSGAKDLNGDVVDKEHQLPPTPSPRLKRHKDFMFCMPPDIPTYRKYSVFLAGSIEMGDAIQWQKRMEEYLEDLPITVCNPRRGAWDPQVNPSEKDEAFRRQVTWELSALENVSVICFFFDTETKSPVTMLELGLWARSGKVVVCCGDGFWKSGNVHITCARYGIPYVKDFTDLVPLIKKRLSEKGMKLNDSNDLINERGNVIENKGPVIKSFDDIKTGIQDRKSTEEGKPVVPHLSKTQSPTL
jgi:hypothetical protein